MLYMPRRCERPQPPRVTRTRGWTLSASLLSRFPPPAATSKVGALERPRGQEQQPTPSVFQETPPPTSSLASHLFPERVTLRHRRNRRREATCTTRWCDTIFDSCQCLSTGTTWWSSDEHDTGVPGRRRRPPASAEGHDAGVPCARLRPPLSADEHDVVVDRGARIGRTRSSATPASICRWARCGCALFSSKPAGLGRQAGSGGRPRGTTRASLVVVDAGRRPPRGTKRWCPAEVLSRQSRRVHRPHKETMPPRPPLDGRPD